MAAIGCGTSENGTPEPPDSGAPPSRDPVLDGGGEIPAPPNGSSLCPAGVCNYQTGTGCGADGGPVSCVPLPMGSTVQPACERAGRTPDGDTCAQWTDCVSGSICAAGRCRKLCCGRDWTGCGTSTEHCLRPLQIQLADNSVVASGAYLCYPVNQCDALVPSSCAAIEPGTTCQIADPTGATACLPEGGGGVASACPCRGDLTGWKAVAGVSVAPCREGESLRAPRSKASVCTSTAIRRAWENARRSSGGLAASYVAASLNWPIVIWYGEELTA